MMARSLTLVVCVALPHYACGETQNSAESCYFSRNVNAAEKNELGQKEGNICHMLGMTHLATGDGVRGLSGRFGCSGTGRSSPFPGGGTGFLGGTIGAGLAGFSGRDLSTLSLKEQ